MDWWIGITVASGMTLGQLIYMAVTKEVGGFQAGMIASSWLTAIFIIGISKTKIG